MKQVQFRITDPALDIPPMAFCDEADRDGMLDYLYEKYGIELADIAQIVFTSIDDDGKHHIDKAYQYGKDVTHLARFA